MEELALKTIAERISEEIKDFIESNLDEDEIEELQNIIISIVKDELGYIE